MDENTTNDDSEESYLSTDPDDLFYKECWRHKDTNLIHHTSRPAIIYHNGSTQWKLNGLNHRENGLPSCDSYRSDGKLAARGWEVDDHWHRLDGPAYVEFDDLGNIAASEFWIKGKNYPNELDYWVAIEKYKQENTK